MCFSTPVDNNQGGLSTVCVHEGEAELGDIGDNNIQMSNFKISFTFIIICLVNVCLQKLPIEAGI